MQRLGFWSTACSFLLILLNSIHPESSHMFSFHHSFESGSKPGRGKVFQCLQQPMKVICLIIEVMEGKKGSYTRMELAWPGLEYWPTTTITSRYLCNELEFFRQSHPARLRKASKMKIDGRSSQGNQIACSVDSQ